MVRLKAKSVLRPELVYYTGLNSTMVRLKAKVKVYAVIVNNGLNSTMVRLAFIFKELG